MIRISHMNLQKMVAAAEFAYPNECCGLLAGLNLKDSSYEVSRVVESRNVHPTGSNDRFEVDPKVRFNLMRELGEIGKISAGPERLLGHYHSHPDHPATPSEHDFACAFESNLFWIILSLSDGSVRQVGAYQLNINATQFHQIPLRQTNGAPYSIAPDQN